MPAFRNRLRGCWTGIVSCSSPAICPAKGRPPSLEVGSDFHRRGTTCRPRLTATSGSPTTTGCKCRPRRARQCLALTPPLPAYPYPWFRHPLALPCDRVKLIADVTYPDGTRWRRDGLRETWRLQNAGSCTWTSAYTVVFSGGKRHGHRRSFSLTTGSVAPGENVDVSITMKASDPAIRELELSKYTHNITYC